MRNLTRLWLTNHLLGAKQRGLRCKHKDEAKSQKGTVSETLLSLGTGTRGQLARLLRDNNLLNIFLEIKALCLFSNILLWKFKDIQYTKVERIVVNMHIPTTEILQYLIFVYILYILHMYIKQIYFIIYNVKFMVF